jgi:hypothetical protein
MPDVKKDSIIIFDVEPEQQAGPGGRPLQPRGGLDVLKRIAGRSVPIEQVQNNITGFLSNVQDMLAKSVETSGDFSVQVVEINAQISGEGQVGFMGSGIGVSGSAGITFVLKRRG